MKSIAIDFDGVIHSYDKGWQDGSVYGTEIPYVFESIQELMKTNSVFIFSTRKPKQIKRWLLNMIMEQGWGDSPYDVTDWSYPKYGFKVQIIPFWVKFWNKKNVLGITKRKLRATAYIDDRAIRFDGDWLKTIDEVKDFKTYQELNNQFNEILPSK